MSAPVTESQSEEVLVVQWVVGKVPLSVEE